MTHTFELEAPMAETITRIPPSRSPEMDELIRRLKADPKLREEINAAIAAYDSGEDTGVVWREKRT